MLKCIFHFSFCYYCLLSILIIVPSSVNDNFRLLLLHVKDINIDTFVFFKEILLIISSTDYTYIFNKGFQTMITNELRLVTYTFS